MKLFLNIGITTLILLATLTLNGCGQSGPLYLPKQTTTTNGNLHHEAHTGDLDTSFPTK